MRSTAMKIFGLLFTIILTISLNVNGQNISMYRGNAQLTAAYNEKPLYALSKVKFTFPTSGAIRSTPAFSAGKLFFGSGDGVFYSIDAQRGLELWRFKTGGAIQSSPAVVGSTVFFSSRDGWVYALNSSTGKEVWKFKMGPDLDYKNGWDFYLSSPNVVGNTLYIGSGDGHLYALDTRSGKQLWKFNTGARVRTTPAVFENVLIGTSLNGNVYALDRNNGKEIWKFSIKGIAIPFEKYGYDATGILCAPIITEGVVLVGGRDGYLYGIDFKSGKELWNRYHNTGWILGLAASKGMVYASGGFGYIEALDLKTGEEKWRVANAGGYSGISINDDVLYHMEKDAVHAADLNAKGSPLWRFPLSKRTLATPVVYSGTLYFSSDDGILYAVEGTHQKPSVAFVKPRHVVFWEAPKSDRAFRWFTNGVDLALRDFFNKRVGYELMNRMQLKEFMNKQIESKTPSVVVFADNEIPYTILGDRTSEAIIRKYIDAGGRVVFLGPNPAAYRNNAETGENDSVNFQAWPKAMFNLNYVGDGLIQHGGFHDTFPTAKGKEWGLRDSYVGYSYLNPSEVTEVLGVNDYGMAASWFKNYGGPAHSGILQIALPRDHVLDFSAIRVAIEKGLDW